MKKTLRVVAAILVDRGRVFATQRGYGPQKDGWEFPGGKIEAGEQPREALILELREELAVQIEAGELLGTVEYDYPDFHLSMDCFLARIREGQPMLKEHEAARWLGREELDALGWLPADRSILDRVKRVLALEEYRQAKEAIPPGRYRHFKGRDYEVLGVARHSETEAPLVVYRPLYGEGGLWVRPAAMWNELVERDGTRFQRFTKVPE